LFFTAHKQLLKQAKQVRTFLVQRGIRKGKQQQSQQQLPHHQPSRGGSGGGGDDDDDDEVGEDEDDDGNDGDSTEGEKPTPSTSAVPASVQSIKNLDLEVVTQQALRQLGLYHCNPRLKQRPSKSSSVKDSTEEVRDDSTTTTTTTGKPVDRASSGRRRNGTGEPSAYPDADEVLAQIPPPLATAASAADDGILISLVNTVLTHGRFLRCMEEWNEKVTDYRRWCLQLEDRASGFSHGPFSDDPKERGKRKRKGNSSGSAATSNAIAGRMPQKERRALNQQQQRQPKSMFVTLGGVGLEGDGIGEYDDDDGDDGPEDRYSAYGPGGGAWTDEEEPAHRRNRKGQRARRAKAMAIQAKRESGKGRDRYYQSLNWRTPKTTPSGNATGSSGTAMKERSRDLGNSHRDGKNKFDEPHRVQSHHPRDETAGKMFSKSASAAGAEVEKQHPSWAAKQAQQTGIVAFKGTKITFD
jgi:hypothetical protein